MLRPTGPYAPNLPYRRTLSFGSVALQQSAKEGGREREKVGAAHKCGASYFLFFLPPSRFEVLVLPALEGSEHIDLSDVTCRELPSQASAVTLEDIPLSTVMRKACKRSRTF